MWRICLKLFSVALVLVVSGIFYVCDKLLSCPRGEYIIDLYIIFVISLYLHLICFGFNVCCFFFIKILFVCGLRL
ncbi:hypothetical protein GLYMA_11G097600v4 [Glycine max]|uniref:Uncharacterized protein n=1 Tax=Glycine max TaxID=3847 RepID=A0A0R0HEN4_SOYBN|nr:hypothetical protein GLYMA_11G097600v4 [Glycine max]